MHEVFEAVAKRYAAVDESIRKGKIDLPAALDRFARSIGKDGMGRDQLAIGHLGSALLDEINEGDYSIPFTVSVLLEDRDGDVVEPMGCRLDNYRRNPIWFFGHQQHPVPIAKSLSPSGELSVYLLQDRIKAVAYFDKADPDSMFLFGKVQRGFLNATSIAFVPLEAYRRDREERRSYHEDGKAQTHNPPLMPPGWYFKVYDLTEISLVGVPSNAGAIRDSLDKEKSFISPRLQKALLPFCAKGVECWAGWCEGPGCETGDSAVAKHASTSPDPRRWNKSLSSVFDGPELEMEAPSSIGASTMYRVAAKYLQCEIKDLFQNSSRIPSPRMGSFLTGIKHVLADYRLVEIRNIRHGSEKGMEAPPVHETIQLNSRQRDSFLVEGTAFYEGNIPVKRSQPGQVRKGSGPHNAMGRSTGERFVVRFEPEWNGLGVTVFTTNNTAALNQSILDRAWTWAKQYNFLKGEAFALSGEFLQRTDEGWEDVFLEDRNKEAVQRTLDLFNGKQLNFANRGMILTGPPGTGKTLSGRVIRNKAQGTFIWVSSRDFHASGSVGGLSMAFSMAKELAPAIIFMEDVDNWLHPTTIDLLKTEMDGISRSKGVLTILTTNFPEKLPDALIDRPGRFHDVLEFDLPTQSARKAMLTKWLPLISSAAIDGAVNKTGGYSGAHVYELARFAETLQEHDGMEPVEALETALQKVDEQRELITRLQLEGSNYNPLQNRLRPRQYDEDEYPMKMRKSHDGHACGCAECKAGKTCGCAKGEETKEQPSDEVDPEKACRILKDGHVNGEPLTEDQRKLFGAACSRSKAFKKFLAEQVQKKPLPAQTATRVTDSTRMESLHQEIERVLQQAGLRPKNIRRESDGFRVQVNNPDGPEFDRFYDVLDDHFDRVTGSLGDIMVRIVKGRGKSMLGKPVPDGSRVRGRQIDPKSRVGPIGTVTAHREDSTGSDGYRYRVAWDDPKAEAAMGGQWTSRSSFSVESMKGKRKQALAESSGGAGGYTVGDKVEEEYATCPECDGSGNCLGCDGVGEVAGVQCLECGGSGECIGCAGAGFTEKGIGKGKTAFRIGDEVTLDQPVPGLGMGASGKVVEVAAGKKNSPNRYKVDFNGKQAWVYEDGLERKSLKHKGRPMKTRKGDETPLEDEGMDTEENKGEATEEAPFEPKHSATVMAHLHDHANSASQYLKGELDRMDNPAAKEDLQGFHDEMIAPQTDRLKEMLGKHHPDHDMDEMMKGLGLVQDTGTGEQIETGEENKVERGEIPPESPEDSDPEEEAEEETEERGEGELDKGEEPDEGVNPDDDTEEILERYQHPKSGKWMTRKTGQRIRKTRRGVFLVRSKGRRKNLDQDGTDSSGGMGAPMVEASLHPGHHAVVSKAADHMDALAQAPDLPMHHQAGLMHHGGELRKICKELDTEGTATGMGETDPAMLKGRTKTKAAETVPPAIERQFMDLQRLFRQTGIPLGGNG